ncbi:MAG TPA: transposase [Spirochaetota bacterium]|nr:transposase [Spirochaetota bacterium]HNT11116.1 transposase [Spirochaetota bacterium]
MPRPHRICIEEATYHVFSRCIDRRNLMLNDSYKEIMINTIEKTQEKYVFELAFYQILDNHVHLVIKTCKGEATISRIMQYIKARFAETYNRKNGRTGPFWNERFGDVIVESQPNPVFYLMWLLWYLAYNAVRKAKVDDPREYLYGSINYYLDGTYKGKLKISIHRYFMGLGNRCTDRLEKFITFEEMYRKRLWMSV